MAASQARLTGTALDVCIAVGRSGLRRLLALPPPPGSLTAVIRSGSREIGDGSDPCRMSRRSLETLESGDVSQILRSSGGSLVGKQMAPRHHNSRKLTFTPPICPLGTGASIRRRVTCSSYDVKAGRRSVFQSRRPDPSPCSGSG